MAKGVIPKKKEKCLKNLLKKYLVKDVLANVKTSM